MYKNAEGYSDPTPGEAMSNIRKEAAAGGRRTPRGNQQAYPGDEADGGAGRIRGCWEDYPQGQRNRKRVPIGGERLG